MSVPDLNDDFVDFLTMLLDRSVEFVLVGAHAMAVHGVARATGDMDVLVRPEAANARKVLEALGAFGAPVEAHGVKLEDFEREGNVYQMGLPPRRIDVLTSVSGIAFDEIWATRMTVTIAGMDVPVIGLEALVRNKEAAARDKDLLDAKLLRQLAPRRTKQ